MPTLNLSDEEADTLETEIWGLIEDREETGDEDVAKILEGIGAKLVNLEYNNE